MGPVEFHEVKTTNVTAGLGTGGFFYVGVSSDRTARFKLRLDAAGVCTVSGNGGESKPSFVSHGLSEHGCPLWKELVRVSRPRDFETDFMVEVGFLVSTFCLLNDLSQWSLELSFQDSRGLGGSVPLKESQPVLLTFQLLPYMDVGGSLHVRLSLDDQLSTVRTPFFFFFQLLPSHFFCTNAKKLGLWLGRRSIFLFGHHVKISNPTSQFSCGWN
jgi:hypothetical protein